MEVSILTEVFLSVSKGLDFAVEGSCKSSWLLFTASFLVAGYPLVGLLTVLMNFTRGLNNILFALNKAFTLV